MMGSSVGDAKMRLQHVDAARALPARLTLFLFVAIEIDLKWALPCSPSHR